MEMAEIWVNDLDKISVVWVTLVVMVCYKVICSVVTSERAAFPLAL